MQGCCTAAWLQVVRGHQRDSYSQGYQRTRPAVRMNVSDVYDMVWPVQDPTSLYNTTLSMPDPPERLYVFHGLVIVTSVSGLVFNLLNISILASQLKRLNSHSRMVLNQCCCCTLICFFTLIEHSIRYQEEYLLNEQTRCVIMVTTIATKSSYVAVFLNMILVTFSRFVAVWRPTAYPTMLSARRTTLMIAVILAIVGLLVVAQFIFTAVKYADVNMHFCFTYFLYAGNDVVDISLAISVTVLFAMIPCVYTYIVVVTRRKRSLSHNTQIRAKSSVTVTSFWIVVTFVLSYTAYYVMRLITKEINSDALMKASVYVVIPIVANCTLDPLMYAVRMPDIRAGYAACWKRTRDKRACTAAGQTSTMGLEFSYSARLPVTAE